MVSLSVGCLGCSCRGLGVYLEKQVCMRVWQYLDSREVCKIKQRLKEQCNQLEGSRKLHRCLTSS